MKPKELLTSLLKRHDLKRRELLAALKEHHTPKRAASIIWQELDRGFIEERDGIIRLVTEGKKPKAKKAALYVRTVRQQVTSDEPDPTSAIMELMRKGLRFIVEDDGQELEYKVTAQVTKVTRV